jgi:hypothetical protein
VIWPLRVHFVRCGTKQFAVLPLPREPSARWSECCSVPSAVAVEVVRIVCPVDNLPVVRACSAREPSARAFGYIRALFWLWYSFRYVRLPPAADSTAQAVA